MELLPLRVPGAREERAAAVDGVDAHRESSRWRGGRVERVVTERWGVQVSPLSPSCLQHSACSKTGRS
jgi:hypothetical protein